MNKKKRLTSSDQRILRLLNQRMEEIAALPPQELGLLTTPFKLTAFYIKNYSLIFFFAFALTVFLFLRIVFGERLMDLVSILQQAF